MNEKERLMAEVSNLEKQLTNKKRELKQYERDNKRKYGLGSRFIIKDGMVWQSEYLLAKQGTNQMWLVNIKTGDIWCHRTLLCGNRYSLKEIREYVQDTRIKVTPVE